PAGQLLVGPEPRPEWVYFTRRGTVRLFQHDARGHEVTVEHLDPGHLFGVTSLLGAGAAELLAAAETDVELCAVEGSQFLEVVSRWPAALLELALRLGVRLPSGEDQVGRLTATRARA